MNTSTLIKIVEAQLKETSNIRENTGEFISKVVHLYKLHICKDGIIPLEYLDDVLSDIEHEAVEIFRKKTYGFLTLEEYRRHKFKQLDDN